MYKVKIEQTYNVVELEFKSSKDAVGFIDEAVKNCNTDTKTTFKLECVVKGGETNES